MRLRLISRWLMWAPRASGLRDACSQSAMQRMAHEARPMPALRSRSFQPGFPLRPLIQRQRRRQSPAYQMVVEALLFCATPPDIA